MIRFGILAGVSTDPQVQDKASIPDQIQTCRAIIAQMGGVEVGCYTMDGYSRSGYDSLADAMADIPPLKEAIESAEQNLYDVLILDNWDRLGDLGLLVNSRFKRYNKQLYSARQSGRLHDPENYDPYADESADTDMYIQGLINRYRINKMQRGRRIGMPKRIENGLNPLRVPFGYRWVSPKDPPSLVPASGALVQQMKDLFLAGRSLGTIARHADASGIAPANGGEHWEISAIRYMLANPFYAGLVGINRSKYIFDPKRKHKKRMVMQPRAKWKVGQGKHEPLWDDATHRAILREFERRHVTTQHYAARFPLSGLLTCSECRRKLHRRSHGHGSGRRKVFSCEAGPAHIIIPYDECVDLVAREITGQLADYYDHPQDLPADVDTSQAALEQLEKERKKIQSGFKSGIYSEAEAAAEIAKLVAQKEAVEQQSVERLNAIDLRAEFMDQFHDHIDELPDWIKHDPDPQVVHRVLSALCQDIIVHPDRHVEVVFRPLTRG